MPSVDDIAKVCRGNMQDVWKHLLLHVRRPAVVRHVRSNLKLHFHLGDVSSSSAAQQREGQKQKPRSRPSAARGRKGLAGAAGDATDKKKAKDAQTSAAAVADKVDSLQRVRSELKKKRDEMVTSVQQCRSKLRGVRREMQQLQDELCAAEETAKAGRDRHQEQQQRKAILHNLSRQLEARIKLVKEYERRMRSKAEEVSVIQAAAQTSCHGAADRHRDAGVFSSGETTGNDVDQARPAGGGELKRTPADFLELVTAMCDADADQLSVRTDGVDLLKEAQMLKYRYENEQLTCVEDESETGQLSSKNKTLQTLVELMEERRTAHISRFLETESALNEVHELQKNIERLLDDHRSGDDTSDQGLAAVRELQDAELALAGAKAGLATVAASVGRLVQTRNARKSALERLQTKHEHIERFEEHKRKNDAAIQELILDNMKQRAAFQAYREHIASFAHATVQPLSSSVRKSVAMLKAMAQRELSALSVLSTVPLADAEASSEHCDCRQPVWRLAIQQFQQPDPKLLKLLQSCEYPWYKSADALLPHMHASMCRIGRLERHPLNTDDVQASTGGASVSALCRAADDIFRQSLAHEEEQVSSWVPVIRQTGQGLREATGACDKLEQEVDDWWQQPAQFAAPWLTVDNRNVRQWVEEWRSKTTRLRELEN